MIPMLTRDTTLVRRTPEWPAWPRASIRPSGALFEERPPLRKLVVLVDADALAASDGVALTPQTVLTGLLRHPYVKAYRFRDEGPPADVGRWSFGPPDADLSAAEGWAELLPPDVHGVRGVQFCDASLIYERAVFGADMAHARNQTASAAYADRSPEDAADQRECDELAAEAAQAVGADLFITERPYLFEVPPGAYHGLTICQTAEALALVALYLRLQHEFIPWCLADGNGRPVNEWLYYQIGAVELLPRLWRWSEPGRQAPSDKDRERLGALHESLIQRVQRALRTRDGFHRAYSLSQTPSGPCWWSSTR